MFIGEEEIDEFIVKADELYKYINDKKGKSEAISNVDTDFFLLYLYSNELIKQSVCFYARDLLTKDTYLH